MQRQKTSTKEGIIKKKNKFFFKGIQKCLKQ